MTDPDDLGELLAPRPADPSPGFRDELLRRTERHLARGRWVRRGVRAAVVAVVFVAGGAAGWFARTPVADAPGSPPPPPEVVTVPVVVPVPVPVVPHPGVDTPGSPGPSLSATDTELRAEQTDDRAGAARLYRQAGDAFLRAEDYANAARCYRLFLNRLGDTALSPEPDDSWLLTSIKNAAFKEKADAKVSD